MPAAGPDDPDGPIPPSLRSLWEAVRMAHTESPRIGEYVALEMRSGEDDAAAVFPDVVEHLATGCVECMLVADAARLQLLGEM